MGEVAMNPPGHGAQGYMGLGKLQLSVLAVLRLGGRTWGLLPLSTLPATGTALFVVEAD